MAGSSAQLQRRASLEGGEVHLSPSSDDGGRDKGRPRRFSSDPCMHTSPVLFSGELPREALEEPSGRARMRNRRPSRSTPGILGHRRKRRPTKAADTSPSCRGTRGSASLLQSIRRATCACLSAEADIAPVTPPLPSSTGLSTGSSRGRSPVAQRRVASEPAGATPPMDWALQPCERANAITVGPRREREYVEWLLSQQSMPLAGFLSASDPAPARSRDAPLAAAPSSSMLNHPTVADAGLQVASQPQEQGWDAVLETLLTRDLLPGAHLDAFLEETLKRTGVFTSCTIAAPVPGAKARTVTLSNGNCRCELKLTHNLFHQPGSQSPTHAPTLQTPGTPGSPPAAQQPQKAPGIAPAPWVTPENRLQLAAAVAAHADTYWAMARWEADRQVRCGSAEVDIELQLRQLSSTRLEPRLTGSPPGATVARRSRRSSGGHFQRMSLESLNLLQQRQRAERLAALALLRDQAELLTEEWLGARHTVGACRGGRQSQGGAGPSGSVQPLGRTGRRSSLSTVDEFGGAAKGQLRQTAPQEAVNTGALMMAAQQRMPWLSER